MLKRFNRWLRWQIQFHQDKKRAPEIIARIRRERGLPPQGDHPEPERHRREGVKAAVGLAMLREAAKSSVRAPLS